MATFQKREGVRGITYRARVKINGRVRGKTFKRLTDAKQWAAQTETELTKGAHVPTSKELRRTVDDMVERYLADILPNKRMNKDQRNPKRQLQWWASELGDVPLVALTPDIIAKARDRLVRESTKSGALRSPATANRYLAVFSHCCRVATNTWQWLPDNPCRKVESLAEPKGRIRFLSDDERKALLNAAERDTNPHIYDLIILGLCTGMRAGELTALTWVDVNLERRTLTLHDTKNNETRVVPITGPALPMLAERSKVRRLHNPHVFPGRSRGSMTHHSAFVRVRDAAGLEDFRFHDLRHTAASYLAMNGATPSEIADVLGHKTLQMVKRYAHLSEQHTASVLERMTRDL